MAAAGKYCPESVIYAIDKPLTPTNPTERIRTRLVRIIAIATLETASQTSGSGTSQILSEPAKPIAAPNNVLEIMRVDITHHTPGTRRQRTIFR